ncbi:hypothetical protein NHJ13734_007632 [Beauveria thailandica]
MCSVKRVQYTCGCIKDGNFKQCELRKDTPIKCDEITRDIPEPEDSYCLSHCMFDRGRGLTSADFEPFANGNRGRVGFRILKD